MSKELLLRPHHALCLQYFIGQGYGGEFVENMFHIKRLLCEKPDRTVILHSGTDCICAACPNNRGGVCLSSEKVARYDRECLKACGIAENQAISWAELRRRAAEKIIRKPEVRNQICFDCLWKTLCQQQDVENSVENVKNP
jgi:hypothetical protein